MKHRTYFIDFNMVSELKSICNNMTFEESKKFLGHTDLPDEDHLIGMTLLEADILFVDMINGLCEGEKFTLSGLTYKIGQLFGMYEEKFGKEIQSKAAEDASDAIQRCINVGMFKEAV